MRSEIAAIIGGKLYDTKKATLVASDEYWDGHNRERQGRNSHLYKTAKGNFFLGHSSMWQEELNHIELLTPGEAKKEYEELPEKELSYQEAFGEDPEEA